MKLHYFLPWALLSFLVYAQQPSIKPQIQGEVSFVSGGIGADERDALQLMRADYNLHLLFSMRDTGEYLSDIKVIIADATGNDLLETVAEGPMIFARLKPGRYSISAHRNGHLINKTVNISNKRSASLSFTWPR